MSQVSICDKKKVPLLLTADDGTVRWVKALGGSRDTVAPFDAKAIGELAKSHELVATDAALEAAAEASDGAIWDVLGHIHVFARMSPTGKAKVIRMMQEQGGHRVLMCGDGGNDCGALKQADIGLALLSGYGDVNTLGDGTKADGGKKAEESLNAQAKEIARKSAESAKIQRAALAAKQKELQALQQVWMREEVAAAEARGEDLGMSGHFRIMKSSLARMQRELVAERRRLQAVHGNVFDQKDAVAKMTAELGAEDSALPMVRRRPHRPISRAPSHHENPHLSGPAVVRACSGPPGRRVGCCAIHVSLALGAQYRRPHPAGAVHAAVCAAATAGAQIASWPRSYSRVSRRMPRRL